MYTLLLHLIAFGANQSKEDGKDQEQIQSSTTLDPGHRMGKCQKHKKTLHTREPRGKTFPSKAAMNRQDSMTDTKQTCK